MAFSQFPSAVRHELPGNLALPLILHFFCGILNPLLSHKINNLNIKSSALKRIFAALIILIEDRFYLRELINFFYTSFENSIFPQI